MSIVRKPELKAAEADLPVQSHTWNVRLAHSINTWLARHSFRGAGAAGLYAGRLLMQTPRRPTVIQTAYGTKMVVDLVADNHFYGIEPSLYYAGGYERGTLEVMRAVMRQGDCYIDAGANIGAMSLWAAKLVGVEGKVYCFEPEPTVFASLKQNIALNEMPQICPFNAALGASAGSAVISRDPHTNRGSATLAQPAATQEGSLVQVLTLDETIEREQIKSVRMLKVDVEGWELEVLRGAQQLLQSEHAPILCVEYSCETNARRHEAATDIYAWIAGINKYQVYKLRKGKQNVSQLTLVRSPDDLPQHDNLFCFLPGHLSTVDSALFRETPALA